MPARSNQSGAAGAAAVLCLAGALGGALALSSCSKDADQRAADGGHHNQKMDVWTSAGRKLAKHPAVGTWRTDDDPRRPTLIVTLEHDRTGVMHARSSPLATPKTTTVRWRTDRSGRVTVHKDFGTFPSHRASLTLELEGRSLRAVRTGAGLRTTDRLVRSTAGQ